VVFQYVVPLQPQAGSMVGDDMFGAGTHTPSVLQSTASQYCPTAQSLPTGLHGVSGSGSVEASKPGPPSVRGVADPPAPLVLLAPPAPPRPALDSSPPAPDE
jgi:hypothetical protein